MRLSDLAKQMALRTGVIFIVKAIGFFARIVLFRFLGAEGIGFYQMTYSVYVLILTVLTGGFPTAIALATAGNRRHGWQLFKITAVFSALFGIALAFYGYVQASRISLLIGDERLKFAIQCIAPAVAIVPFLSIVRGFLQGIGSYGHITVSELIEQLIRIVVMIMIAAAWLQFGIPYAVGGSMLGASAGAAISLCFLLIIMTSSTIHKLDFNGKPAAPKLTKSGVKLFFYSALAIFGTRLVIPLSDFLDAIIIPHRLQDAGLSLTEATSVYGIISGMAATIVYMPMLVIFALTFILFSQLASDWEAGRIERFVKRTRSALEIVWLWGCGSALVLFFYAGDLANLLFSNNLAETAIRYMALVPLVSGIRELSTVVLWGSGNKKTPFIGIIIGSVCSLMLNYWLIAIPGFGYAGAAIGILSLEVVGALWNMKAMRTFAKGMVKELTSSTTIVILLFTVSLFLAKLASQAVHLPRNIQSVGEMTFIYGCIIVYVFMLFIKKQHRVRL